MSRRVRPVPDGTRAPGCAIRGCANAPRQGALICDVHARALGGSIKEEDR